MTAVYTNGERDIVSKFFAELPTVASPDTLQQLDFLQVKRAWDRMSNQYYCQGKISRFKADNSSHITCSAGEKTTGFYIYTDDDNNMMKVENRDERMNDLVDGDWDDKRDELEEEYESDPRRRSDVYRKQQRQYMPYRRDAHDRHLHNEIDQLSFKQRAMYKAFIKDFEQYFKQDGRSIQAELSKIPIHHQRYVQTHLVISPSTNIARSNLLRHLLHSLFCIQQLQGKINCFSRLKKTVHYNNFFVFYDHLQQRYRMSSTEFVKETKHLFTEGDNSQIKRRIIRYRKLGERLHGIITAYDKVILLFPDMMTKPRMEDLTDATYNMIYQYVQPKTKPLYSIPALPSPSVLSPRSPSSSPAVPPPTSMSVSESVSPLSSSSSTTQIHNSSSPSSRSPVPLPFSIANLCSPS